MNSMDIYIYICTRVFKSTKTGKSAIWLDIQRNEKECIRERILPHETHNRCSSIGYLNGPVKSFWTRTSPMGLSLRERVGFVLFFRPTSTGKIPWYGTDIFTGFDSVESTALGPTTSSLGLFNVISKV